MGKTAIGWTDFSSNPLRYRTAEGKDVWACVKKSTGCLHCYCGRCNPLISPGHAVLGKADEGGDHPHIHWVIIGGESGTGARPMEEQWAESIKGQCQAAGVACFVKQLGGVRDNRHDIETFPLELRVREFPKRKEVAS